MPWLLLPSFDLARRLASSSNIPEISPRSLLPPLGVSFSSASLLLLFSSSPLPFDSDSPFPLSNILCGLFFIVTPRPSFCSFASCFFPFSRSSQRPADASRSKEKRKEKKEKEETETRYHGQVALPSPSVSSPRSSCLSIPTPQSPLDRLSSLSNRWPFLPQPSSSPLPQSQKSAAAPAPDLSPALFFIFQFPIVGHPSRLQLVRIPKTKFNIVIVHQTAARLRTTPGAAGPALFRGFFFYPLLLFLCTACQLCVFKIPPYIRYYPRSRLHERVNISSSAHRLRRFLQSSARPSSCIDCLLIFAWRLGGSFLSSFFPFPPHFRDSWPVIDLISF